MLTTRESNPQKSDINNKKKNIKTFTCNARHSVKPPYIVFSGNRFGLVKGSIAINKINNVADKMHLKIIPFKGMEKECEDDSLSVQALVACRKMDLNT